MILLMILVLQTDALRPYATAIEAMQQSITSWKSDFVFERDTIDKVTRANSGRERFTGELVWVPGKVKFVVRNTKRELEAVIIRTDKLTFRMWNNSVHLQLHLAPASNDVVDIFKGTPFSLADPRMHLGYSELNSLNKSKNARINENKSSKELIVIEYDSGSPEPAKVLVTISAKDQFLRLNSRVSVVNSRATLIKWNGPITTG